MFTYIQIAYLIICILEAWLEQSVIYLKNPNAANYGSWNKKEHVRSAIYAMSVGIVLASFPALYGSIITSIFLVVIIPFIRRIGFDVALKKIRGRRISDIEGDQWVDNFMRGVFGKKGGWLELLTNIAVISLINYLYWLL